MDLVLSDIHANLPALKAVLDFTERKRFDRIVVLGDLVGYGAHPVEVMDLVMSLESCVLVRGNHDRACAFPGTDQCFSSPARHAARWSRARLRPAQLEFLRQLPEGLVEVDGAYAIAHGAPGDEDMYLLHPLEAEAAFYAFEGDLCFHGHTHLPGAYELDPVARMLRVHTFEDGAFLQLKEGCRYLVNPGSVGQPRDRDPRLSFMMYDPAHKTVRLHRLEYDISAAAKAILDAGLHSHLAERLAHGI